MLKALTSLSLHIIKSVNNKVKNYVRITAKKIKMVT